MVTSIQRVADTAKVLLTSPTAPREEVVTGIQTMERPPMASIAPTGHSVVSRNHQHPRPRADDIGKIIESLTTWPNRQPAPPSTPPSKPRAPGSTVSGSRWSPMKSQLAEKVHAIPPRKSPTSSRAYQRRSAPGRRNMERSTRIVEKA